MKHSLFARLYPPADSTMTPKDSIKERESIVAISTPPGSSGIGIVRMSGKDALPIAEKIFRSSTGRNLKGASHRILHGFVARPGSSETIDEVLLTVALAPKTYTREDTVEINCHGGRVALEETLSAALEAGARLAEPGEFTKRAFLNGRIDLAQAEAVIDTIHAKTSQSLKASHRQLRGSLSLKVNTLIAKIWEILVRLETNIDFLEEDIPPFSKTEALELLEAATGEIGCLKETWQKGRLLREGANVTLAGRTNVGKSSLLNAITDEERCIVTDLPGTTRDVISEEIDFMGLAVRLSDTAGIREPENEAEAKGISKTEEAIGSSDLILFVLDGSVGLVEADKKILSGLDGERTMVVINKSDVASESTARELLEVFQGEDATVVSAKTGVGIDHLKKRIRSRLLEEDLGDGEIIVTNARHHEALSFTEDRLKEALLGLKKSDPEECLALPLREAAGALEEIVGLGLEADLLDQIFSTFCVGK